MMVHVDFSVIRTWVYMFSNSEGMYPKLQLKVGQSVV